MNARLPVDRADPVLLALLENHNTVTCTGDCGAGSGDGCVARPAQLPKPELARVEQPRRAVERDEPSQPAAPKQATASERDMDLFADNRRGLDTAASMQTSVRRKIGW